MPDIDTSSLEKIIMAGIGAVTRTAETAGELLEELVKKGELTVEQGKAINEELKHNIKGTVSDAKDAVKSTASDAKEAVKSTASDAKEAVKSTASDAKQALTSTAVSHFIENMDKLSPEDIAKIRAKIDELESAEGE